MSIGRRIRKRERQSRRRLAIVVLLLVLSSLLILGLGRRSWSWIKRASWDGKSQINLAVSQTDGGVLVLILTPEKQSVLVLTLPVNLLVKNCSLGTYQTSKLVLLARQERSNNIFAQSLEYTLNVPVDKVGIEKQISTFEEEIDRSVLRRYFLKQFSFDSWRIWRYLGQSSLTWKTVSLTSYTKKELLPDGAEVLELDSFRLTRDYSDFLTDPLVKNEGLTVSVFNVGSESGTAQKLADLMTNFGARIVEVSSRQDESPQSVDCQIILSKKEFQKSWVVRRLVRVFDCQVGTKEGSGMGEIEILVKSAKI